MPDKLPLDRPAEKRQYHIHVEKKLPPSFSELGNMALIRYFIKATAVRVNRLKTAEMTAYEPIIFLPIDNYDLLMTDDKQAYTRREFVMKDKYPEIVGVYEQKARSPKPQQRHVPSPREGTTDRPSALIKAYSSEFLKSFFTTPGSRQPQQPKDPSVPKTSSYDSAISRHEDISSSDLSPSKLHVKPTTLRVVFEMRLRYPAFLIPSRLPNYQLYLLTRAPPEEFQLFNGQSSGLGFIYLRYLKMELVSITDCYVSSYKERVTKKKTIFEEDSLCYLLDLAYARRSKPYKAIGKKMYEITIPKKLYREAVIPDSVPPSFRTCNMERRYKLIVSAGFSDREEAKKGAIVTLETNVQVMSGIEPVMKDPDVGAYASRTELDRAMREAEFNTQRRESSAETTTTVEDGANGTVPMADDGLPTYDEVVKESTRRRVFAQDDFYYININD
ncbi:DEKNAAC102650 [Brettanomyces naardenensis]|uniref:DEKNAAC102650 n=1 Tax=Brettanomyces naardenensis TaxID=13370 RepID=A0A448YKT0_BRENA|nr:DEKNAAC102650 [Brettanomyces naardenensis]